MRIAVLRCERLPSFITWEKRDAEVFLTDDRLLLHELADRGAEAESVVWADPAVDWSAYDVAVIRSTWDYIDRRDEFVDVLSSIDASRCRLLNPLEAVRWNTEKSYLFDLEAWGVPVLPTLRAFPGDAASLQSAATSRGWGEVVIKPLVGAGAADVRRLPVDGVAPALAGVDGNREFLLQPLVESVITEGEWSFIFLGGELSHVLLKRPAAGDYRAHGIYGGSVTPVEPAEDDRRQAQQILVKLPFDLAYARLDLVRFGGSLAVMEIEVIEPMLYLDMAAGAAGRLADTVLAAARSPLAPEPST